jgi:hypothetical protein
MAAGRIRRTAHRGIAVAVLTWLGVAGVTVATAPTAVAAPTATVPIRDLTPPVVSVDAGGSVTFVNEIQDKTVQVGGGGLLPTLTSVTASTEVTLGLPSGPKVLTAPGTPGSTVTERFDRTCATCTITYTYKLRSNASLTAPLTDAALKLLPPLPAPTPFVVNTILPDLPNVPGVNLPQLPAVTLPTLPGNTPAPPPNAPPVTEQPREEAPVVKEQLGRPTMQPPPGNPYTYNVGAGAVQLSPADSSAAAAFDPSRFFVPGGSLRSADRGGSAGAGGVTGSYDGASVPVFGQLAGLDSPPLDEGSAGQVATASDARPLSLPAAALAAVVALAAVTAALVRTAQAARESR